MPTKKATSSRTPAAARKSAPQLRRTAAQSQQPRESRGPSQTVVSPGARPLQTFWPVFSPELVTIAITDVCRQDESDRKTLAYLMGRFATNRLFRKEQNALLDALSAPKNHADRKGLLQLCAARVFQAAFTVGYYQGRAATLKAAGQGGAL